MDEEFDDNAYGDPFGDDMGMPLNFMSKKIQKQDKPSPHKFNLRGTKKRMFFI